MYRKILEFCLNALLGVLFIFIIYSVKNGWNLIWFSLIVIPIFIGFVLIVTHRIKPKIDLISTQTAEIERIIVEEISSSFSEILKRYNFILYHREINCGGVDIRYKREKDRIIFRFSYYFLDFPDFWGAEVIISNKNLFKLFFTTILHLKNPKQPRKEKLPYSLINKKGNGIDEEQIKITVNSMREDFKYASEFLENDYDNIKEEYRSNKKFYNNNYSHLFSHVKY